MPPTPSAHPATLPCPTPRNGHDERFERSASKQFTGSSSVVENEARDWANDQFPDLARQVLKDAKDWRDTVRCKRPCGKVIVLHLSSPDKEVEAVPIIRRGQLVGWEGRITVYLYVTVVCRK
jgi:hypothetical protein